MVITGRLNRYRCHRYQPCDGSYRRGAAVAHLLLPVLRNLTFHLLVDPVFPILLGGLGFALRLVGVAGPGFLPIPLATVVAAQFAVDAVPSADSQNLGECAMDKLLSDDAVYTD